MSPRFFLSIPRPASASKPSDRFRAAAAELGLSNVELTCGLTLFLSQGSPNVTSSPNVTVVGYLFTKARKAERLCVLSADQAASILKTRGDYLVQSLWGGYLAILVERETVTIVRDPSGVIPCYIHETSDGINIASDMDILRTMTGARLQVDWTALRRHLIAFDLRSESTVLRCVSELLPGCRLVVANNIGVQTPCWSPWKCADITSMDERAQIEALYECVTSCVEAWAQCFDHVLANVSGGLDSSILAAALARSDRRVTCLNMATSHPSGDERTYARELTRHLHLPLLERMHLHEDIDLTRTGSTHLARPILYPVGQSEARQKLGLSQTQNIDAFFTGIGGDGVFCHMQSATPAVDRYRQYGLSPGLWRTILDICDVTGASLVEVCRAAITRQADPASRYVWRPDLRFLKQAGPTPPLQHAWLEGPCHALPGKAAHIAMLTRVHSAIDGYHPGAFPIQIHPLLSQPIVELCLSMPTWSWVSHGQNRSIARSAFETHLPQTLIRRRGKGGPNGFAHELVRSNRLLLEDFLANGLLAGHGIIDPYAVTEGLDDDYIVTKGDHLRILMLAEAEAWARYWEGDSPVRYATGLS